MSNLRSRLVAIERKRENTTLPPPTPMYGYWDDGTRFNLFNVSFEDGGPGQGNPRYEGQDAESEN